MRFVLNEIGIRSPSYMDIGAHHPFEFSNTAHFYLAGSRGINIEPNPLLFKELNKHRRHDINLNIGVMDRPGESEFYLMKPSTVSTFQGDTAERLVTENGFKLLETSKVKVATIDQILEELGRPKPHILSLDVEGLEERIVRSIDFGAWNPLVICCETISFSTTRDGYKYQTVIEYLKKQGYMVFADTYINTIFVLEDAWH